MKVVAEEPWAWMLFSDEDVGLYMTVMCGTIGLYSVDFQLADNEVSDFKISGRSAIEALARDVSYQSSKYQARHIDHFDDLPGIKEAVSAWRSQSAES